MSEDDQLRQEIAEALQDLAQDRGVQRDDLIKLLEGKLQILATAWGLERGSGLVSVRSKIYDQVMADLPKIAPRKRQGPAKHRLSDDDRRGQFERVVRLLLNLNRDGQITPFAKTQLMGRYALLEIDTSQSIGVDYSISKGTARRDFDYAREELAKLLVPRVKAAAKNKTTRSLVAAPDLTAIAPAIHPTTLDDIPTTSEPETTGYTDSELTAAAAPAPAALPGRRRRSLKRPALVGGTVVVLLGGLLLGGELSGLFGSTANSATSLSSSSGQPPIVSSTTGPVMVTSVAYMRDDGTPGAWSYAFAQTLSPKDVASYGTVSQDQQQYQEWAFAKDGVTVDDLRLQIGLRGNQSGTVVIQNVEVTKQCRLPLSGTLLYVPPQGVTGDLGISIDLDRQFPVAEDANMHTSYFGTSGGGHTITLANGEAATLLLDATTSRQYCTFSLMLVIQTSSGQEVREIVDDHGKPFQVTAAAGVGSSVPFARYHAVYIQNGGETALVPVNPQTFEKATGQPSANSGG